MSLYLVYIKNFYNSSTQTDNPILDMDKGLKSTLLHTRHANGHQADDKIGGKCKLKPQCNNSSHTLKWLLSRKFKNNKCWDFPGGAVVKHPPANAGDTGSIPGLGRPHMPRATEPVHHNY